MKTPADHYSQAWNKLLELAIFGQKSEALGLAKLLGHLMNDKILALQLQAELYLLFNDIKKSKELYQKIAEFCAQNSYKAKYDAVADHIKLL